MSWEWLLQLALPYIAELIIETILPLFFEFLKVVALVVGTLAINWWRKLKVEEWIKEMVVDGVLAAQEELWDKLGREKFHFAKGYILDRLAEKGIKISEDKLDGLIQGTVKDLKGDFAELWYNNPSKEE